jgi:hypothetical protein
MEYSKEEIKKLDQLSRKMGNKQASVFLSVLGRDLQFLNAINSAIGQEIYKDLIILAENIVQKIIDEKDEPKDRAELRAYLNIMKSWNQRIDNYYEKKDKFNKLTGGN